MKRAFRDANYVKIEKRLRLFGPFVLWIASIVLFLGVALHWRLHNLAYKPLLIAHLGQEKTLVNAIFENAHVLLGLPNGETIDRRLQKLRLSEVAWTAVHSKVVEATLETDVPAEIRRRLEERVFPLYCELILAIEALIAFPRRGTDEDAWEPQFRVHAQTIESKADLYLTFLDHLDYKQAARTREAIEDIQWIEGLLILLLGLFLFGLGIWLSRPARRMLSKMFDQLNIKDRLGVVLDVSKTGMFIWNKATDKLEWDHRLGEIYGVDPETIRSVEDFLEFVVPEDRPKVFQHIESTLKYGEHLVELRIKVGNDIRWIHDRTKVIQQDGETKIFGACIDLTELHREMERAQEARVQAEEANTAKTTFITHMSHDMRTPLAAILGFAEQMRKNSLTGKQSEELIEHIIKNGQLLLEFIEDLLDTARLEEGEERVVEMSFALQPEIDSLKHTFHQPLCQKNLEFSIQYHDPLPGEILSDPRLLGRILYNLISNAIRYSERGQIGVDVRVAMQGESKETEGGAHAKAELCIEVSDEGRGIEVERHSQIFERFSPREKMSDSPRSTGLGLYIAHQLARILGGHLRLLRSAPGQGSVFQVSIPVGIPPAFVARHSPGLADAASPKQHLVHDFSELRVLVVEDNSSLQLVLEIVFRRFGIACQVVGSGEEALSVLAEQSFDLVTMDIGLPRMDGLQVTRELRRQGYRGCIVAVSAHAFAVERERALASGCNDYLTKPIQTEELAVILRSLLAAKHAAKL